MPADEKAGEHSWYVKETLRRIREGYDRDLSLTLAAEELGISPGYLSRVFKEEMGTSYADYLTDYRIGQAMRMMSEHRYGLKEIARPVSYTHLGSGNVYHDGGHRCGVVCRNIERSQGIRGKIYRKRVKPPE